MDMPNHALQTSQLLASSLHFWWIAFLRCSHDYWWICQQNGDCQDERLVKVWEDFGNLFDYDSLNTWWHDKGPALFDSPQAEIALELPLSPNMLAGLEVLSQQDLTTFKPGMLYLAIPLTMDSALLNIHIARVFKTARVRGEHYTVGAKYRLETMGKKGLPTVVQAYLTHALKICVAQSDAASPIHRWGGYRMAQQLALSPQNQPKPTDTLGTQKRKQNSTRSKHSQVIQAANALIANVEVGRFPSRQVVKTRPRWSAQQQQGLDQAMASGTWQPRHWLEHEHSFMLPQHSMALPHHPAETAQTQLAILADLQGIELPFLKPVRPRKKD